MKFKFPLVAVFVAMLSLTACGGGGSSNTPAAASPAALSTIDTVVGTGTTAANGKKVTVNYTGWLYSETATGHKGAQFDAGTISRTLGTGELIAGFEQGVVGMKVGGKRTILIPASLGYGSASVGSIPPNSGLVFDVELTAVQ